MTPTTATCVYQEKLGCTQSRFGGGVNRMSGCSSWGHYVLCGNAQADLQFDVRGVALFALCCWLRRCIFRRIESFDDNQTCPGHHDYDQQCLCYYVCLDRGTWDPIVYSPSDKCFFDLKLDDGGQPGRSK